MFRASSVAFGVALLIAARALAQDALPPLLMVSEARWTNDDGTRIQEQVHARDSAGRRYRRHGSQVVIVDVPTNRLLEVDPTSKVALIRHMTEEQTRAEIPDFSSSRKLISTGDGNIEMHRFERARVLGIDVVGYRAAWTSETGSVSWEFEAELWESKRLKAVVQTRVRGKATPGGNFEIERVPLEIVVGEPDPALFYVPEDYQVEDMGNLVVPPSTGPETFSIEPPTD